MRINFIKTDHIQVTIPPGSEEEARKFYSGLLGLEETEKPDSLKSSGGVWFKIAGIELHLGVEVLTHNDPNPSRLGGKGEGDDTGNSTLRENFPSPSVYDSSKSKTRGGRVREGLSFSKRHPAFEVENIGEVKKYLSGLGVKLKEEIPIPGRERFSFYDPFGNRIELLEYLAG